MRTALLTAALRKIGLNSSSYTNSRKAAADTFEGYDLDFCCGKPKETILLAYIYKHLRTASLHHCICCSESVALRYYSFFLLPRSTLHKTIKQTYISCNGIFELILFSARGTSSRKRPTIPYTARGRLRESFS